MVLVHKMWIATSLSSFLLIFANSVTVIVHEALSGKILANLPGVLLTDYRFGYNKPYVMFYERSNYRGKVYFHVLKKACQNLPEERRNWASSVDVQRRCITVCDEMDCEGNCTKIYAHPEDVNNKGAKRLSDFNMNDKIKSVKFCYHPMK